MDSEREYHAKMAAAEQAQTRVGDTLASKGTDTAGRDKSSTLTLSAAQEGGHYVTFRSEYRPGEQVLFTGSLVECLDYMRRNIRGAA